MLEDLTTLFTFTPQSRPVLWPSRSLSNGYWWLSAKGKAARTWR